MSNDHYLSSASNDYNNDDDDDDDESIDSLKQFFAIFAGPIRLALFYSTKFCRYQFFSYIFDTPVRCIIYHKAKEIEPYKS